MRANFHLSPFESSINVLFDKSRANNLWTTDLNEVLSLASFFKFFILSVGESIQP